MYFIRPRGWINPIAKFPFGRLTSQDFTLQSAEAQICMRQLRM